MRGTRPVTGKGSGARPGRSSLRPLCCKWTSHSIRSG